MMLEAGARVRPLLDDLQLSPHFGKDGERLRQLFLGVGGGDDGADTRLGNELRRLQKEAATPPAQNKVSDPPSEARGERERNAADPLPANPGIDLDSALGWTEFAAPRPAPAAPAAHEIAGASGYVEENTSGVLRAAATGSPSAPAQAHAKAA